MWVLLGGVLAALGGVLAKVLEVSFDGRGSWARRAIRADLDLLDRLPDAVKDGEGGQALIERLNRTLVSFSAAPRPRLAEHFWRRVKTTPDQGSRATSRARVRERHVTVRARFVREVDEAATAISGVGLGAVLLWLALFFWMQPIDMPAESQVLIGFGSVIAVVTLSSFVGPPLGRLVVASRWRRVGRPVPDGI